jgi:membrane peptidoglycan carboxypeptidase
MHKQPGSTIKPLVVYTPILERGYTKTTTVDDSRFSGGPSNSNGVYNGSIPLYYAVEQSKNVVAWRLFQSIGPKTGLSYLQKMHFTQIVPNDYYPAASLGGLTYGCTTTEMSSGYYTIFNKGVFVEPTCLVSIVDSSGSEVYEEASEERVYKNNAAVTMREIMEGVFKNGTARGLGLTSGMPCAGKTGTTSNQTNGWFCGFTPYYTCAVWVGTDGNKSISGLWGSTYPGSIWKDVQTKLCADKKIKSFDGSVIQEKTTEAAPVYVQNTQSKPSVSKTKKPASTSKSKSTNEDAEDSDFESAKDIDSSDVSVVDESSEDTGDVIVIE